MGSFKRAAIEFQSYPEHLILDFEDIFWRMRRDVAMIYEHPVDWDEALAVLFQGVSVLENSTGNAHLTPPDHQTLVQCALELSGSEDVFPGVYDVDKMEQLYRIFKRAGLEMKERLLELVAYRMGAFPYTFRTMITDGCLFFSKNESIYDPRVTDPGF